jgi:acyl-CoA thioester hydrolase
MGDCIFEHRVRSYEIDHQSFLFNGRYLEICDAAMTEFFRAGNLTYPQMLADGFDPAVVNLAAAFFRPGKLDDLLKVHVKCIRVGTSSADLSFDFTCESDSIAQVRTTYVNVDPETGRSRPIPEGVRSHLTAAVEFDQEEAS